MTEQLTTLEAVKAELAIIAGNMERFPWSSATMDEAGRLAANAMRNIADRIPNTPDREAR